MDIKVITMKSVRYKYFIGFSSNPEEFIKKWIEKRHQYKDLKRISLNHFTVIYNDEETHFKSTTITDGEDFFINVSDNCMGFNDFH